MNRATDKTSAILIANVQQALVEEASAYERLWEIRDERWRIIQEIREASPELSEQALLYQYQSTTHSGDIQVEELRAETAYREAYRAMVQACNNLSKSVDHGSS